MPKTIEKVWNPNTGKYEEQIKGSDDASGSDDSVSVAAKAEKQNASGLGSKIKGTAFTPPKQNPGESSSEYGARVAAARRKFEAAQVDGQKSALRGMK